jgi:transposase-like protein
MSLPSISSLRSILFNRKCAEEFLEAQRVFYDQLPCPSCGNLLDPDKERQIFRCDKRQCNIQFSRRKHTFFFGSRLNCAKILHLAYCWLNHSGQKQAINETGCGSATVTRFYKHFRELVTSTLEESDQIIGGDGIEVQIDETKLGKRKYNRGHRVEGVWIVAGVERTQERKIFLVRVEDRTAETLLEVIRNHVAQGSKVITDRFRSYSRLSPELGFDHLTVNHSVTFKDPITGANTNTIEGNNNALKIAIRVQNRTKKIESHLSEFIWRRKKNNNLWGAFIEALREIHYDLE